MARSLASDADLVIGKQQYPKTIERERRCLCGTRLSPYNKGELCARCQRKASDARDEQVARKEKTRELFSWGDQRLSLPGLTVDQIITAVAKVLSMTRTDLLGTCKLPIATRSARRILSYLLREDLGPSLHKIATVFESRNFTTIFRDSVQIQAELVSDQQLQVTVAAIRKRYPQVAQITFIERGGKL